MLAFKKNLSIFIGLVIGVFFLLYFSAAVILHVTPLATKNQAFSLSYSFAYPSSTNLAFKQLAATPEPQEQKLMISSANAFNVSKVNSWSMNLTSTSRLLDLIQPVQQLPIINIELLSANQQPSLYTSASMALTIAVIVALLLVLLLNFTYWLIARKILVYRVNCISAKWLEKYRVIQWLRYRVEVHWLIFCVLIFIGAKLVFWTQYACLSHFLALPDSFATNMCHWDCGWYSGLINNGYALVAEKNGAANWAFFPIYPLMVKFIAPYVGLFRAGIILNQLMLLLGIIVLYDYVARVYSHKAASWVVVFVAFSPTNIYHFSVFTEATFFCLSALSINLISRKHFFLALIACAALSATRVVGVAMAFVLVYNYLINAVTNQDWSKNRVKTIANAAVYFIFALSGLWLYMLYLYIHVGDALAFYHVQAAWGRSHDSWLNPLAGIINILRSGYYIDLVSLLLTLCALAYLYQRRRVNELIFLAICVFMPLFSQNLASFTRFAWANYALYIFLADYAIRRIYLRLGILACLLMWTTVWLYLWMIVENYPA